MKDLKMPTGQRLVFLQKYCDGVWATLLPEALTAWERATRLIVLREMLLTMRQVGRGGRRMLSGLCIWVGITDFS
jgi:hypothetical protein